MDDIIAMDWAVAVDDLFEDGKGLVLWEGFSGFDRFGEILSAQLSDDVDVVFGVEDVVNLDDVFCMFELLKYGDLVLE